MSAIRHAIYRLEDVVGKLEGSVETLEDSLSGAQRTLFESEKKPVVANGNRARDKIVAERLDKTIAKVERLLQEG